MDGELFCFGGHFMIFFPDLMWYEPRKRDQRGQSVRGLEMKDPGDTIRSRLVLFTFLLSLTFFWGYLPTPAPAAEPFPDPILRIETGMHTAMITRIGVDAENRYLVTSSNDKTVRVWELRTGRLIRTLRIPIGHGSEGKIYAVDISPDGRTIACGGWTGYEWDQSNTIYLFDRESGFLFQRITEVPTVINHLAYSRDGQFLLACMGQNVGIRLYRTSDYRQVAEDRDYGQVVYSADFLDGGGPGNASLLATASYDGMIRLYELSAQRGSALRLLSKEKARGGERPASVSFSPSGSPRGIRIAVGYEDTNRLDLYSVAPSGSPLRHLHSPDTGGNLYARFLAIAWSRDGRNLYAGGIHPPGSRQLIRKWSDSGQGRFTDIPSGADDTLLRILSLRDGSIVFGAADPSFGIFDAQDNRVLLKKPSISDFREVSDIFLISDDGSSVQTRYHKEDPWPIRFSVLAGLLSAAYASGDGLRGPIRTAAGLQVTDWQNHLYPKINGAALTLDPFEMARCYAISPDRESVLLGADWYLRLYDRRGREKWKIYVPGSSWAVNISGNGRVAVAALADGTLRWYAMADGRELLALFLHNDRKRWVAWTPSGYYGASAGAEDIIGWHINNGKEKAADFYPLSRFRTTYYRPDVIARILETADEGEAIRLADAESGRKKQETDVQKMLPPLVEILSPADNAGVSSSRITVRYSVRTPTGEPVTSVKALIDGRPASAERGLQILPKDKPPEMEISIPERDCEISIIAENRFSASEPATIRLRWRGESKSGDFVVKPKLYLLSIGVSRYDDPALRLDFPGKDARDFAEAMKKQKELLYREVAVKVLTDGQATRDEIMDGLEWLQKETTGKDVAMVFLAGHGVNDPNGIYYYLPANANIERLKRTGVAFSDIKNTLASLAGKTILFVDTCHAGNVMGKRRAVADINAVVNELSSAENGAIVFASSSGNQYSLEDSAWGNGAFTKALVEGIGGRADYGGRGKITINMLDLYLSERVKELTKGRQTPTTTKPQTIPDFPIAVKRQ